MPNQTKVAFILFANIFILGQANYSNALLLKRFIFAHVLNYSSSLSTFKQGDLNSKKSINQIIPRFNYTAKFIPYTYSTCLYPHA